jgi:formylglycine-generating enzyme required for sulfatase activity
MNIKANLAIATIAGLLLLGCQTEDQLLPSDGKTRFRITGQITGQRNAPIAGIEVKTGAFTAVTDSTGRYVLAEVPNGTHIVTPKLRDLMFMPSSRTIDVNGQDIDNQNFTVDYSVPQSMEIIVGGSFSMGFSNGDIAERPVHTVTVKTFAMARYEVTQQQWQAVMGSNPSYFKGDSLPVERISWYDAIAFCNALSLREGLDPVYIINGISTVCDFDAHGYRLPTEAEWEYACRCGTTTDFYSGDQMTKNKGRYVDPKLDEIGWYDGNAGGTTHKVGLKRPNGFGLFDITGNVFEWCWDWRGEYPGSSQTNPTGPTSGDTRICRGGSWFYVPYQSRTAFRNTYSPDSSYSGVGIRVVRTIL